MACSCPASAPGAQSLSSGSRRSIRVTSSPSSARIASRPFGPAEVVEGAGWPRCCRCSARRRRTGRPGVMLVPSRCSVIGEYALSRRVIGTVRFELLEPVLAQHRARGERLEGGGEREALVGAVGELTPGAGVEGVDAEPRVEAALEPAQRRRDRRLRRRRRSCGGRGRRRALGHRLGRRSAATGGDRREQEEEREESEHPPRDSADRVATHRVARTGRAASSGCRPGRRRRPCGTRRCRPSAPKNVTPLPSSCSRIAFTSSVCRAIALVLAANSRPAVDRVPHAERGAAEVELRERLVDACARTASGRACRCRTRWRGRRPGSGSGRSRRG